MKPSGEILRAGILAAGRGERLRTRGAELKPLVRVGGETLIERVLNSMANAGASEVAVIINEDSRSVRDHVAKKKWPFALRWIIETTPSSMHSFLRLVEILAADGDDGPFLLSTVDTVASPNAYAEFIERAREETGSRNPGPDLAGRRRKTFARSAWPAKTHALQRSAVAITRQPAFTRFVRSFSAKRMKRGAIGSTPCGNSWAACSNAGTSIAGIPIAGSIDVDRPEDIEAAEAFLRTTQG